MDVMKNSVMDWKEELRTALRTAEDLFREGYISESELPEYSILLNKYQFLLPESYAKLIDRSNPSCPIRRQAIPSLEELKSSQFSRADPLDDFEHRPVGRVTHRYFGRVLVHLTPNCSMYCRYCFRKSLLNEKANDFFQGDWKLALQYVQQNETVSEVIFSGGDPFLVSDFVLASVIQKFSSVKHVLRLRFHTRVPVTLPSRVDRDLLNALEVAQTPLVIVMHFNHPRELSEEAREACRRLKSRGFSLLNQSVLLRGVNDSVEVLSKLSTDLFQEGVLPYYLHHPDPAKGTESFWVPVSEGKDLYYRLQTKLPGYLVPRYVADKVGEPFKRSLFLGEG